MSEQNPFTSNFDHQRDEALVNDALAGDQQALNTLVKRHNNFIYNIAIKMLGNIDDAADVTQEILIKLITNLAKYDSNKAQLRTWLYRMAFNYILNYKKSNTERSIVAFDQFFDFVDAIEDEEEVNEEEILHLNPVSQEAKIKCMTGMLMCIPRQDRLLYIVGDFFRIDHKLGAELFNLTPANFRKKLSRTRQQLREWMHNRCGLINKDNPCRCARKTKGFIARGIVNPTALIWNKSYAQKIADYTTDNLQDILRSSDRIYASLFQEHPFKEHEKSTNIVDNIIADPQLRKILEF